MDGPDSMAMATTAPSRITGNTADDKLPDTSITKIIIGKSGKDFPEKAAKYQDAKQKLIPGKNRVEDADAPFKRSPHELPDINVNIALNTPEERQQLDYLSFLEKRGITYKKKLWERRKIRQERKNQRRLARLNKSKAGKKKLEEEEEV